VMLRRKKASNKESLRENVGDTATNATLCCIPDFPVGRAHPYDFRVKGIPLVRNFGQVQR
jgi:hypothetical protein